ncbi:MAG: S4 domain-containing protein [Porticoccaceae bacterium]|nr:hypothetical protein [Pseudomonadales bacterium]MCP5170983.1 hypothetical protein [Pseudomonadales bacterium]MCP5301779.1 hypothetical protein [Pseudomonadales bacterium]
MKSSNHDESTTTPSDKKIRLDKWLWAARFFKTRALAKEAITGGKIHIDGQRAKPAKEISVNSELKITRGQEERTVVVTALSAQRRSANEAALLYRETEQSRRTREEQAATRRAARDSFQPPRQKPDKKQRRHIHRFKQDNS